MEKKREGDMEAAGEVFLSSDPLYHCFFGIGDGKGELLKLLLLQHDSYSFAILETNKVFVISHSIGCASRCDLQLRVKHFLRILHDYL
jgi:hypothetical protein